MNTDRFEKIIINLKDADGKVPANKLIDRLNTISFWELLNETSKIEIPIIQRDYAQGRIDENTNRIRKSFLDSIMLALDSENNPLELDFVYGDIKNDVFRPLDGQQRLTTLFLLHWYAALHSFDSSNESNLRKNQDNFKKFSYETRISSREFCSELVEKGESLGRGEKISDKIQDSSWFLLSWKKDPTVKAMLVMLDSIEKRLKVKITIDLNAIWHRLTNENPPITFHFRQLIDVGLTDDLYIKMNARGKALTEIESFKARFQKYVEQNNFEKEYVNHRDRFSYKMDKGFTDLFWKHRGTDNMIDNKFIKFLAGIAICSYAQNLEIYENKEEEKEVKNDLQIKLGKTITEESIKRERIERRITALYNNPKELIPEDFPSQKAFKFLKYCLEVYSSINSYDELFPEDLPLWELIKHHMVIINKEEERYNNLFINFIKDSKTEYKQRVLFYAQTVFLLNEFSDLHTFPEWMRVIRNIVQNATIDSVTTFIGAIGLINELAAGCRDIYDFLSKNSVKSAFASNQVQEEILKASLITADEKNKEVIFLTEDTNFCKGKIGFALYCAGFENSDDHYNADELSEIQKVIHTYLNDNDISNDFRQALFTIKDNRFYDYWNTSWLFAVNKPKRCLIANIQDLKNYAYNPDYREYLKELLLKLISQTLDEIIDNYVISDDMPNWKRRIIKEEGLLDYSEKHFIAVDEPNCCWLIPGTKVSNSEEGAQKLKKIE